MGSLCGGETGTKPLIGFAAGAIVLTAQRAEAPLVTADAELVGLLRGAELGHLAIKLAELRL